MKVANDTTFYAAQSTEARKISVFESELSSARHDTMNLSAIQNELVSPRSSLPGFDWKSGVALSKAYREGGFDTSPWQVD